jgi:phosphoserine phosphatase RsbU/P
MTIKRSILLLGLTDTAERQAVAHFTSAGHGVITGNHGPEGDALVRNPQLEVVYLQAPRDTEAIAMMKRVRAVQPALPIVLVCAQESASLMRDAWHAGAADVAALPFTAQILDSSLERAVLPPDSRDNTGAEAQARFRYLDETGKERWAAIVPPRFTMGRSSTNDLVLSPMSISRSQAEVVVQEGEYILRDIGSKHGTYVNGTRIDQAKLNNGDRVQLGGLQGPSLTFHTGDLLQSLLGISESKPEVSSISVRGFREMGTLLSTLRALSSTRVLDDLLALVVDTAIELTGAERGFIMLKDASDNLTFRCARNSYKRPLDGSSFQTSRRVPDEAFKTGKRVVINDLDFGDNPDDHSSTRRLGLRSIFCVPLRYLAFQESGTMSGIGRMETIGVLYVDSQNIGTGLSNTQLDALETLASEAAMAIYNALLYKISLEKRKMDEELAIAREIQQALLPNPTKVLPFVNAHSQNFPCREVGGDYFDYFDMDAGRLGFALGDVAGKGMPAALLTSMIQGIFSAQTLLDLPLPAVISNVNRNLVKRGTGNRFVTFFFGILDAEGNCTYTNAGHNPPFVLSPDGALQELTEGGMVLGLFGEAQYESRTIRLQPGDHVVLYTDGVLEARNTAGDEFGEERLRALLKEHCTASTTEILNSLNEAIVDFSANTPQHDDITMMVLGFQETDAAAPATVQVRGSEP